MTCLQRACLALSLALFLPSLNPLLAQADAPRTLLGLGSLKVGTSASFESWISYFEKLVGPEVPETVVHSTLLHYSARKPLYDDAGYPLLGADGQQLCKMVLQSGRVFFPPTWRVPLNRSLPLVVYTHATTMLNHGVASEYGGHEWMLGAAAAVYYGFAVAMPDQPGMGVDAGNYHPFCHAKSLAYSTVDGIPAMQRLFDEDPYLVSGDYSWDGRLFVVGYSEGADRKSVV